MNRIKRLWARIRGPLGTNIVAREPALASAIASFGLALGAHYGLHFSTEQQAYALPISFFLLNFIVRQCVMPVTGAALAANPGTIVGTQVTVTPPALIPAPAAEQPVAPRKKVPARKSTPRKRSA